MWNRKTHAPDIEILGIAKRPWYINLKIFPPKTLQKLLKSFCSESARPETVSMCQMFILDSDAQMKRTAQGYQGISSCQAVPLGPNGIVYDGDWARRCQLRDLHITQGTRMGLQRVATCDNCNCLMKKGPCWVFQKVQHALNEESRWGLADRAQIQNALRHCITMIHNAIQGDILIIIIVIIIIIMFIIIITVLLLTSVKQALFHSASGPELRSLLLRVFR